MVLDMAAAAAVVVEGRRRRRRPRRSEVDRTAELLMTQRLQEDESEEARVVAHIRRHRRLTQPQPSDSEGDDQQGEKFCRHPEARIDGRTVSVQAWCSVSARGTAWRRVGCRFTLSHCADDGCGSCESMEQGEGLNVFQCEKMTQEAVGVLSISVSMSRRRRSG